MPQLGASVDASTARPMKVPRVPNCRCSGRMSGVFGQKLGRKNSDSGGRASARTYSVSSRFVVRQVKYVYDCENPPLASAYITLGRVNASARKMTSGCRFLMLAMHHRQNGNGFVCGLSTRNTVTPCSIQNVKMLRSSSHSDCQAGPPRSNG